VTTKRLLCLVTDRLRLAATLGRPAADARGLVLQQIEGAVAGGIDLVQIRERDLEAGALLRLVSDAIALAATTRTRIVVNERLDVALAAGAAGVHLRDASFSAEVARRLGRSMLVGRSVHSAESAASAGPVDYLIAGTMFATASKSVASPIGVRGLAAIVQRAMGKPVLAIGGVSLTDVRAIVDAGATGLAAIGAFMPPATTADIPLAVQKNVENYRFAFDTASAVP
jgi:thiamine-phosphate diphosphorylase